MIVIDVEHVVSEESVLIVSHPTGIFYTVQVDGVGCSHPREEGFVLAVGKLGQGFDDCCYGCAHISDNDEQGQKTREKLAVDLDKHLQAETRERNYTIRFDFGRILELKEGWWPVTIKGVIDPWDKLVADWKGFLYTGNCD